MADLGGVARTYFDKRGGGVLRPFINSLRDVVSCMHGLTVFRRHHAPQICLTYTDSLDDGFLADLVKLSPPGLVKMEIRGSPHVTQFICSPLTSCCSLQSVDLSRCDSLRFVLVQSQNMKELNLSRCPSLGKLLIQCRNLHTLSLEGSSSVHTLMIWSDSLTELDLSSCESIKNLQLYCPKLNEHNLVMPSTNPSRVSADILHAPVAGLIVENLNEKKRKDVTVAARNNVELPCDSGHAMAFTYDRA